MWFVFALLSAVFAALTSILAKVGVEGVNSNLATAIRTVVVLVMAWGMVFLDKIPVLHGCSSLHSGQRVSQFIQFISLLGTCLELSHLLVPFLHIFLKFCRSRLVLSPCVQDSH